MHPCESAVIISPLFLSPYHIAIHNSQREKTRTIADHHASLAKTVEGSIVQHLQKLRAEIKAHIKNIQMDTGKLAAVSATYHASISATAPRPELWKR